MMLTNLKPIESYVGFTFEKLKLFLNTKRTIQQKYKNNSLQT